MTMVQSATKMQECGLPMMSLETSGSVAYSRMPLSGPVGGGLDRGVDLVLGHVAASGATVRSVIEPSGTGTRRA